MWVNKLIRFHFGDDRGIYRGKLGFSFENEKI